MQKVTDPLSLSSSFRTGLGDGGARCILLGTSGSPFLIFSFGIAAMSEHHPSYFPPISGYNLALLFQELLWYDTVHPRIRR